MKKIKVLFLMVIASIFMLTACYQRDDYYQYENELQAFKYAYKYNEKEDGYTLFISQPKYKENASNRNPIEYSKDLVPFGQEELVLPSYYEGKPIVRMNVDVLYGSGSMLNLYRSILDQDKEIKHVVLPQNLKEIGRAAFSGCSSLTSINIPESVIKIDEYAFQSCSSLASISIPSSVLEIDEYAFLDCGSLTSIKVDKNNRVYDSRNNCNAIIKSGSNTLIKGCAKTVIPNSVTEIGYDAFYDCSSLTSINIPGSVTKIGIAAFSDCSSLTSISIPSSVTKIESFAFSGCGSLTNLEIPNGVETIGNGTFSGCSSLTSISIPNGVTEIGIEAFADCSSLTSISIPSSVTEIGIAAFSG